MSNQPVGSPVLLLVPTREEQRALAELGGFEAGLAIEAVCGFGPVAAAARTARLIGVLRPARAVLVGIAGSYDLELLPLGSASTFDAVAIDGIGAGLDAEALGPRALGLPQIAAGTDGAAEPIFERLLLEGGAFDGNARPAAGRAREPRLLLTVCAASASPADAALRRRRHPAALAEDMEGFAVACACALAHVPLCVVRGISNVAGERDKRAWRVREALAAARELARERLHGADAPARAGVRR